MYGLLLKTFFRERLSIQRIFGQKIARSKIQKWLMGGLLLYALGVTAVSTTFIQYEIGVTLLALQQLPQLLFQAFTQLTSLGFLFGFFQAQGYLFQYKDFDLLGPLPIPQRVIIASKISVMLFFVYLFALVMVVPTYGVWWYLSGASGWQLFIFIPLAVLAPIPLMLLGSFISYGIRKLTQKWIHANILQTIFSVAFIVSFAGFSYFSNQLIPQTWLVWLQQINLLAVWFVNGISQFDIFAAFGFIIVHFGILLGFIYLMSGPLLAMNQARSNATIKLNNAIPTKPQSIRRHLLRKEWQRFVGTSIYFINTGFGLVMLVIFTLVTILFPPILNEIQMLLTMLGIHPVWMLFVIIGFALSTVYTPAVSLSLEGKNLTLLKSLPIPAWTILKAKIGFNLWLTIPIGLLATFIGGMIFSIEWWLILLTMFMIGFFALLISVFFMYLNLWFPRFDYHHEVEVVKQSLAALLAVFGGFATLGILLWFNFTLLSSWAVVDQLLIIIAIEVIAILVAGGLLKLNAEKIWNGLSV